MGPTQVEEALREALAMGADKAVQLTGKEFAGSDTWATSYTLGLAIQKIGAWDLILCGKEAMDGMTAQVGPQIAEFLRIPQLTYAISLEVADSKVRIKQKLGKVQRVLEASLPALVTVEREINEPRIAPMDSIMEAYEKEIPVWAPEDLGGDSERFGLEGSPTRLRKVFSPKVLKGNVQMLQGGPGEAAAELIRVLKEKVHSVRVGDMAPSIDIKEHRGCWVFVEQSRGKPARVSLELLGKGKDLAEKLGAELTAMVLGDALGSLPRDLIAYGAERVLVAEDPMLRDYRTELYADIIAEAVRDRKPEVLIVGATPIGRDLAPRLSFRLNAGCTADCTGLEIDQENRLFVSTRPAFGGNVVATIICPNHRPQMATVRPGVMPFPEKDPARRGEVLPLKVNINEEDIQVKILESVEAASEGVAIEEAERVVCVGMGGADAETFPLVKELAELLEAELAATRVAVEAGWLTHDSQVGQTGKTIRPDLYVACGISGAVQHTAGMTGSKLVIAINKDSKAEIFNYADYGIVGDLHKVLPAIIGELRALRGE